MSELPTGTVTLLFTDVEGSTRLLQELGRDRYMRALSDQRRLLREAFTAHGGVEVEMQGDSFHFAFQSALDAVLAAAEAQRALAAHAWEAEPIRVRIGIHTGEPTRHEGLYAGLDVHRAARVMSAGHGGQILISQAARDLVHADLPDDVALIDQGDHRLKDLTLAQRIYQLVGDSLPSDFPPIRTLENRPTNLPTQPNALIGRERELAALAELVLRDDVRLVTLTGPGGTGKTRLPLHAAPDLLERFPGGVFLVSLASIREPELVLPTIAQTLGLRVRPGENVEETLGRYLGEREILLLLDNFEQVIAAAPRVASLLRRTRTTKLLVTSREALRVQSEHVFRVPALELPDPGRLPQVEALSQYESVALFIERARAMLPEFEVTTANAPAVAEICVRLDGLPLAIELAAARIPLLPPEQLLARLGRRFALLTGGARDADERQQTLRQAIEWSYDLLSEEEQRLLRRLAVFAGSFDLDAAEEVCGADLDALQSLVEKNLVRRWGSGRLGMLETIHEHAAEKLEQSGEAAEIGRRHSDHFLGLVELRAREGYVVASKDYERLLPEQQNLRRALETATARGDIVALAHAIASLWSVWLSTPYAREGIRWVDAVLARRQDLAKQDLVRVLLGGSELMRHTGDLDSAERLKLEVLELGRAEPAGASFVTAALADLSEIPLTRGELAQARAYAEESVEKGGGCRALSALGEVVLEEGDLDAAARLFEDAARGYEGVHAFNYAFTLEALGETRRRQRDFEAAEALFGDATRRFVALGDQTATADCLDGLAALAVEAGDLERAGIIAGAAARLREEWERPAWGKGRPLDDLPTAAIDRGRRMMLDEAVAFALKDVEPLLPKTEAS